MRKANQTLICLLATFFEICFINISVAEPWPFIERSFGPQYYLGDNDARLGHENFIAGNYGNAEYYFRRAVEVTPQNGAAWLGLASCYDRLGRFDLAERSYNCFACCLDVADSTILSLTRVCDDTGNCL